jgi:hypothetical protein
MFNFIASILLSASINSAPVAAPACETLAPNLDGISITICDGEVVSRKDAAGVVHFAASTY